MNDTPSPAPLDVRPVKQPFWQRLSLVWIVPFLALAVSLGVAWQNYAARGVLIQVSFANASGVAAGETTIKYRDVTVGQVEKVEFAEGLTDVVVYARIDKTVAPYLDDDAQFWVVRPDVSVRGITGLETVLSGVFIEGNWDTVADVPQTEFRGLEKPELTRANQRGTQIVLRTLDGSILSPGAPILHKGINVGYIEKPELSADGNQVFVNAFVEAPYDRRLTTTTRFWDTSGFSVTVGSAGLELNVSSIASLIEGGIAFDTLISGGQPIRNGQVYEIFYDEQTARDSLFETTDVTVFNVAALFEGSVSGLTVGSTVRYQGIRIGRVSELSAIVIENNGRSEVQLRTVLAIEPRRLGLGPDATPQDGTALLADLVAQGLRARLITGNVLSGTLIVQLLQVDDTPPGRLNTAAEPYPILPITDSEITDVTETAEDMLERINDLPVEELMNSAINLMDSLEQLTNDESMRQAPASLVALLDDARALVSSEDIQAVPADLRKVINDLDAVLVSVTEAGMVDKLTEMIETASKAAANVETATQNLPAITAELETLAAKANSLEVEALVTEATETLAAIDDLLRTDGMATLPGSLSGALDELRLFLTEVREGGAIENVNAALASANEAAKAIEEAAASLPALSETARALVIETEQVIASYGDRSRFSAETLATLRDVQAAADAISALARAIQRNPNSLITGR